MTSGTGHPDQSSSDPAPPYAQPGLNRYPPLELFRWQAAENPVYREYLGLIGCDPQAIRTEEDIPFLPVELFRTHRVVTGSGTVQRVFESSGTTGASTSRHYLLDESVYLESLEAGFRHFFGSPEEYCILALLPSYLERGHSSLVFMADRLIRLSGHPLSGFYLNDPDELAGVLALVEKAGQKTILLGVTFALLDLAAARPMKLRNTLVIETGGMKGRREELTREEVHRQIKEGFGIESVGSEYGMTELLSQAWSHGEGRFLTPPWMKVRIRDPYDPFRILPAGRTGGIDITDLANRHSCSFISTQDLGLMHPDGSFEVLGRFDHSELRGCNLLITQG